MTPSTSRRVTSIFVGRLADSYANIKMSVPCQTLLVVLDFSIKGGCSPEAKTAYLLAATWDGLQLMGFGRAPWGWCAAPDCARCLGGEGAYYIRGPFRTRGGFHFRHIGPWTGDADHRE